MKLPPLIFLIEEEKFIIRPGRGFGAAEMFAAISVSTGELS